MKKKQFEIQCPFCSKAYTAEMLVQLEDSQWGCETCGPESAYLKIEIRCSNCKKIVYAKKGKSYDW